MKLPLVSICIPTFNGAAYLQEALDSVRIQSYSNIEVIISDDDSSDGTWGIIEHFRHKVSFPVYLYKHTPKGIGANWNDTIRKANGEYIKFLFQDDVLMPDCVEKMVNFMTQNPSYGLVACKRSFINMSGQHNLTKTWMEQFGDLQQQFNQGNDLLLLDKSVFKAPFFLQHPKNKIGEPSATLFKKDILDTVGYFDESLKQILDYVFYYRVLKKYPIAILNESLVQFRIHADQATNVNRGKKINDYEVYNQLMYQEFLPLLHPKVQWRLKKKYHPLYKLALTIKRKIYGLAK